MSETTISGCAARILVVDDTSANLQLLTNLLTEQGYTVHPVSDGELALEFVRTTLPDLVLLDIRMPGMDGYEVCRRLKADERTRAVPVMFISILEDEHDKVRGFREGAVDYINKPFQREEVLARIRTHLLLRELTERLEQKVAERTAELHREMAERMRTEKRLVLMAYALDRVHEAAYLIDEHARFLYVNEEARRRLGYSREELLRLRVADVDPDWPVENWTDHWRDLAAHGTLTFEGRHRTRDGCIFPVEINANYFEYDGQGLNLALVRDITERKRVEESLRVKREQLAAMTVELSLAEERERRRIAAELHDHIGQTLLLGRIKFGAVAEVFEAGNDKDTYEEIRSLLDRTIRDVRSLTQQLHPPLLASVGLEAALEWLARRMAADYSLQVAFLDDHAAKPLTEELAAVVYQSARELLINVAKHAGAGEAQLTIGREAELCVLTVRDQGVGFTCIPDLCTTMAPDCSFGLFNIRQRIKLLGGEVVIESAPRQGTCATIRVPLAIG